MQIIGSMKRSKGDAPPTFLITLWPRTSSRRSRGRLDREIFQIRVDLIKLSSHLIPMAFVSADVSIESLVDGPRAALSALVVRKMFADSLGRLAFRSPALT